MLGPNPDTALLQHLLGGVFHQLHQGAQGGRLAEFGLTQQAGQARGYGASTGREACFLVALQGLAHQAAAAVELGGQGVPINLAALAQLQLVAGPALEGRQFIAGLGGKPQVEAGGCCRAGHQEDQQPFAAGYQAQGVQMGLGAFRPGDQAE